MRIVYFGDGPWAHRALEKILHRRDWNVVLIGARHVTPDQVLRDHAKNLGVPFSTPMRINDNDTIEDIRTVKPDIIVSMSYDQIIRKTLIGLPPLGVINVHAGALPFYRGRNVLNWVLINGESSFGVTCHFVDEGIDTGDIIVQQHVPITPEDDYGSVLTKAQFVCADVLYEALNRFSESRVERTRQTDIHPVGFYCGRRQQGDERLDWTQTAERIHNFVRGISPPAPCARIQCDGHEFAVIKTALIPDAPRYVGTAGEVVGRNDRGVIVKCVDTTLHFNLVSMVEGESLSAPMVPRWKVGTRLGVAGDRK